MGKSLSILALIMKTLDDGRLWAQQQESSAIDESEIRRSRSTLVIVPSARLSIFALESCTGLVANLIEQFWCITG
jgi:hypothetical protein